MRVNEYHIVVVVSVCVIGGIAVASNLKPSPAATDFAMSTKTYSASEFRRLVLYKSQQDVIAAIGKPSSVSDLSGGGQLYTYDTYSNGSPPSAGFTIRDDASGVAQNGAQVRFDAMGQAERVEFY